MNSLSDNEKKAAMKEKFESLLNKRDVKENSSSLTREKLLSLIADVKKSKTSDKKVPRDYWLLQHYDVLEVQGVEKLIVPVTNATSDVMFYCSSDSLFDILHETHLSIGHGGRDRMIKELNLRYKNITQNDIKVFLNFCESCQQKRKAGRKNVVVKPMIFSHMNSRCQVYLIDFQSQPDGNYKFILVYQDHLTKFVVLRPLQTKRAEEIAGQLLDISPMFGAPCILQSDNGREFCNKLIDDLKVIWPEFKIVHGKPRHSQSQGQGSVERANQDIENMLTTWMQDNQSTSWSNGLKFIQFMKNRAFHFGIKRFPYEDMFGCAARVGLSTAAIPKEALNSLVDEDQLQNTLTAMNVSSQPDNEKVIEQTVLNNPIKKL
ncbi:KRAB-A domain-containing protein 2-like [Argiope bruennichi]|uniref:KRAB-A domain-containing protein 2-like n=1 Tax=Argiope bruennichi TaxID=94029 RepID=UPI002494D139|nr:KRAB-A domain-containing protein 2-like [Argiope bruennichi]